MEQKIAFNQFIEQELNEAQKKAVQQIKGPLLVIAGAGSGKTRVITARITNLLINHQVPPHAIVALTFTNKAAREMQERITKFIGKTHDKPFIGTFHSYCLFLLRRYAHLVDLPTFSILDTDDQTHLLQGIIKRAFLEKRLTAKSLSYQLSHIKNQLALDPQNSGQIDPFIYQLYLAYEKEKEASKCIDFDDLLLKVHHLYTKNKEFRYAQQQQVRHLLVDEYQDTNLVQHALLKHMALDESSFAIDSLCAVGDEDQSIYSWRGATVANIMNFKKDFKNTETVTIETNYRSVQPILQTANTIIANNSTRHPKKLVSDRKATDRVRALRCMSAYQEGEILAQFVESIRKKNKNHTVAVLYRAHYQSRSLEEALIRHTIPYKIIGGIQFYERKEIKDILAYVRLVVNPFDRVSFIRAINTPTRGLGDKFVEEFHAIWEHEPLFGYEQVAQQMIQNGTIKGKKAETVTQFVQLIKNIHIQDAPSKTIQKIIDTTRYLPYLQDTNEPKDAEARIENVKELVRACAFFEQTGISSVQDFLHEIALMQEKAQSSEEHDEVVVQLMTLHAAKGLEFDAVLLPGLEEGVFPSTRSTLEPDTMEEERRLLYVGITRAKERLLLSHSRYRTTYGQMLEQSPSRFINELPTHLVDMTDCAPWSTLQFKQYFNEWLGLGSAPSSVLTFGTATAQKAFTPLATKPKPQSGALKVNQLVKHATFGVGLVKEISERGNDIFVSAQFKSGLKTVKATYLERM